MCIPSIDQESDVDNGRRSTYHRSNHFNGNHRISRKSGVTMKQISRILSIVLAIVTIPLVIFAFIKRDAIKEKANGIKSNRLSGISDRIFNNGVSTVLYAVKNADDHDKHH